MYILYICSTLDVNFLCLTQASSLTDLATSRARLLQLPDSPSHLCVLALVQTNRQTNRNAKCYFRKDVYQVCILCICSTLDVNFLCLTQASSLTDLARQYFESQTFVVTRLSVGRSFSPNCMPKVDLQPSPFSRSMQHKVKQNSIPLSFALPHHHTYTLI